MLNLDAGLVLTFFGVIAAGFPVYFSWRASSGPTRKLESLANLLGKLPQDSVARRNVLESIDWQSREVVRRDRRPTTPWMIGFGLGFYALGTVLSAVFLTNMIQGIELLGENFVTFNETLAGAAASVALMAIGLALFIRGRSSKRRRDALDELDKLEEREIVRAHRRRHKLKPRSRKSRRG